MKSQMVRAIITEPRHIELVEESVPTPATDGAVVENLYMAICGSDHKPYLGMKWSGQVPTYPRRAGGHEGVGRVIQVGADVTNVKIGDRVVVTTGYCRFSAEKAEQLAIVPEGVTDKQAALTESVIDAYQALMTIGATGEDTVFISGIGPKGIVIFELVRARGCRQIICSDVLENRLRMAKEMGATMVLNARDENLVQRVREATGGGVTIAFDTSGFQSSVLNTIQCTATRGKVGLFARPIEPLRDFDIEKLLFEQRRSLWGLKDIAFNYTKKAREIALGLIEGRIVRADKIITHEFDLKNINEAFETAAIRKEGLMVVVKCS